MILIIISFQESTSLKSCLSKVKASDIIRYQISNQISSDVAQIVPSPSPPPISPHPPPMGSTDPRSLDLLKQLRDLAKKRHAEVRVPLCDLEGEMGGGSEFR